MTVRVALLGAGGFARETAALVRALDDHELVGLFDDDPRLVGARIAGAEVLGPLADALCAANTRVVACIASPANPGARLRALRRLGVASERFVALVHPTAVVPDSTTVGAGSVLHAGTVCTADVWIGQHVAVMPHVVLTHDDRVADGVTIAAGVRLGGSVTVGAGAYLGAGALVREGITVGERALIGMGAVVLDDVPAGETWVGNPARPIRTRLGV